MAAVGLTLAGSISHGRRSASTAANVGRSTDRKYDAPLNRIASSIIFDTRVLPRNIVVASL